MDTMTPGGYAPTTPRPFLHRSQILPTTAPQYSTREDRARSKGRYCFVSLGCPKNLVDSERMLGLLKLDGYELVHDPSGADFVVVNTCGFIERARAESFGVIDEMVQLKRSGQHQGADRLRLPGRAGKRSPAGEMPRDRSPGGRVRPRARDRRWRTGCSAG